MGLSSKGFWAKVWKIEDCGNFHQCQISTSKKDKDGNYVKDYSGFVRLIGHAHNKAKDIKEGDTIKVSNSELTNNYSKARGVTYTNVAIFEIDEIKGEQANNSSNQLPEDSIWKELPTAEDLPFA